MPAKSKNLRHRTFAHALDKSSLLYAVNNIPDDHITNGEGREGVQAMLLHSILGWNAMSHIMDRFRMFSEGGYDAKAEQWKAVLTHADSDTMTCCALSPVSPLFLLELLVQRPRAPHI